jgi:hypothetical protein
MNDGVTIMAMIVLASFAIERLKAGILFVISGPKSWQKLFPDPTLEPDGRERVRAQRRLQILEFAIAGTLVAAALLLLPEARILNVLGMKTTGLLDFALTWLVLTAGSNQLGDLLKSRDDLAGSAPAPQQLVITGDLQLLDKTDALKRGASGAP